MRIQTLIVLALISLSAACSSPKEAPESAEARAERIALNTICGIVDSTTTSPFYTVVSNVSSVDSIGIHKVWFSDGRRMRLVGIPQTTLTRGQSYKFPMVTHYNSTINGGFYRLGGLVAAANCNSVEVPPIGKTAKK